MKIRQSTKIAIGFVALVGLCYGGYVGYVNVSIANAHFAPIPPTDVNFVGINPGSGYRIIVSNEIAQLVQASDSFGGQETSDAGATEGAIKKRIPIKDLLQVLQGNSKSLGDFVMTMNEMKEDGLPPVRVIWKADAIRRAVNGDATLKAKLEEDLVTHLDGTPMDKVRPSAIENGIVIEAPVSVTVNIDGKPTKVTGYVLDPFKTHLVTAVESKYADKNYNRNMQLGYYAQESGALATHPNQRENVRQSLLDKISDQLSAERVEPVERVLESATVVVNDHHISKASYRSYDTSDGERSDLTIDLTDEGRRRLWKYSRDRVGTQLLLVADGVAIAAPRIQHVLAEGELTITQMPDKALVRDAADRINHHATLAQG